jgi:hypothetical protein
MCSLSPVLNIPVKIMSVALVHLVNDELKRQDFAYRGLERSRLFNWKITATKTLDVMREVETR